MLYLATADMFNKAIGAPGYFEIRDTIDTEQDDCAEIKSGIMEKRVDSWTDFREKLKKKESLPYHDRAVIGLHCRKVCQCTSLDYFSPLSSEHPRLINQRGLFTLSKNGENIETAVKNNWSGGCPWLIKIEISNDQREDFLQGLNLMNINHVSLFPDIYGAARFCNIGIKFTEYSTLPGA